MFLWFLLRAVGFLKVRSKVSLLAFPKNQKKLEEHEPEEIRKEYNLILRDRE